MKYDHSTFNISYMELFYIATINFFVLPPYCLLTLLYLFLFLFFSSLHSFLLSSLYFISSFEWSQNCLGASSSILSTIRSRESQLCRERGCNELRKKSENCILPESEYCIMEWLTLLCWVEIPYIALHPIALLLLETTVGTPVRH